MFVAASWSPAAASTTTIINMHSAWHKPYYDRTNGVRVLQFVSSHSHCPLKCSDLLRLMRLNEQNYLFHHSDLQAMNTLECVY